MKAAEPYKPESSNISRIIEKPVLMDKGAAVTTGKKTQQAAGCGTILMGSMEDQWTWIMTMPSKYYVHRETH